MSETARWQQARQIAEGLVGEPNPARIADALVDFAEEAVQMKRESIAAWIDDLAPTFQCLNHDGHADQGWAPECIAAAIRRRATGE